MCWDIKGAKLSAGGKKRDSHLNKNGRATWHDFVWNQNEQLEEDLNEDGSQDRISLNEEDPKIWYL